MMIRHPLLDGLPGVGHGFFTRQGGHSTGLYASCNVGLGSKDDKAAVMANREACMRHLRPNSPPLLATCFQVHSPDIVRVGPEGLPDHPKADGMVTAEPGVALGVLSADCAPILLADGQAGVIGAAHSGWKGALSGIAGAVVEAMTALGAKRASIRAVIGPCIAQASYQVGADYRARFLQAAAGNARYFLEDAQEGKYRFDLPAFLLGELEQAGIAEAAFEGSDTAADEERFFSYRRSVLNGEPDYGRGLSAIVLL